MICLIILLLEITICQIYISISLIMRWRCQWINSWQEPVYLYVYAWQKNKTQFNSDYTTYTSIFILKRKLCLKIKKNSSVIDLCIFANWWYNKNLAEELQQLHWSLKLIMVIYYLINRLQFLLSKIITYLTNILIYL